MSSTARTSLARVRQSPHWRSLLYLFFFYLALTAARYYKALRFTQGKTKEKYKLGQDLSPSCAHVLYPHLLSMHPARSETKKKIVFKIIERWLAKAYDVTDRGLRTLAFTAPQPYTKCKLKPPQVHAKGRLAVTVSISQSLLYLCEKLRLK